ncbi:hypothetical protein EI94DRAFT_1834546 [Lactarius quietus]|nr:hypothetical protein EI94DRAFT_1834546 [Lactarius quietus]
MPGQRYPPLPNPQTDLDAKCEMDDAFAIDDRDNQAETTPLTIHQPQSPVSPVFACSSSQTVLNAYDLEHNYDTRPPAHHSHHPLTTSIDFPQDVRCCAPAKLLAHLRRPPERRWDDNDGVFAKVTAKPAPSVSVVNDNGDVYMVPEETQQDASYVAASANAVPSYWDNTVHAPSALDLNGDMLIDDLPTGSVVMFVVSTTLISWFFQIPGFILTYLLHGSHAGRLGSQAKRTSPAPDLLAVELSALLHDVLNKKRATDAGLELRADRSADAIVQIVENVSWSNELRLLASWRWGAWHEKCIKLHCVQDVDWLDAIGAFGVMGCAAYSAITKH